MRSADSILADLRFALEEQRLWSMRHNALHEELQQINEHDRRLSDRVHALREELFRLAESIL